MKLFAAFCLAAILYAQDDGKPKPKPTPEQKARELLDATAETATAAKPDVAAMAFAYIAENYNGFDKKKSVAWLRQGFAITAGIPPGSFDSKSVVQAEIVRIATALSFEEAIEMVKQIQPVPNPYFDPRQRAIDSIVNHLIEKQELDRAAELLNSLGATGNYPFESAQRIFEKLPAGDGRREALFGYATSAYTLRGGDAFTTFLGKYWKELPRVQAEAAVNAVVNNILDRKTEPGEQFASTLSGTGGSVTFSNPRDEAFFDLMHIIQEIDPKRAEDIVSTRPVLRAALIKFPSGRESMGKLLNWSKSSNTTQADAAEQAQRGLSDSRFGAATQLLDEIDDKATEEVQLRQFRKALDIVKTIPLPDRKASALGMIAEGVGTQDPALSRNILSQCLDTLKDVKDVTSRQPIWDNIIVAAHQLNDDKLAWEAVSHSIDDATELYKLDTDAEKPNTALRDWWPSTNAFRHTVIAATKAFGVDAEALLQRIADPDLSTLARLEMAATLLKNPRSNWMTANAR